MKGKKNFIKLFFDYMGGLLIILMAVLMATGAWAPFSKADEKNNDTGIGNFNKGSSNGFIALTDEKSSEGAVLANADGSGLPLIIVDAGHGGADAGASSKNGVSEAAINLKIAKLVEKGLREAGFATELTREDEKALGANKRQDMEKRREIMRQEGVSAVVSIHLNKFGDTSVNGPMAFYMKGSEKGEALATAVIENVCASIGNPKRDSNPGDYFILRESIAPAVIVECGFLSNARDEELLQDNAHQIKLANGIVAGIGAYFAKAE